RLVPPVAHRPVVRGPLRGVLRAARSRRRLHRPLLATPAAAAGAPGGDEDREGRERSDGQADAGERPAHRFAAPRCGGVGAPASAGDGSAGALATGGSSGGGVGSGEPEAPRVITDSG